MSYRSTVCLTLSTVAVQSIPEDVENVLEYYLDAPQICNDDGRLYYSAWVRWGDVMDESYEKLSSWLHNDIDEEDYSLHVIGEDVNDVSSEGSYTGFDVMFDFNIVWKGRSVKIEDTTSENTGE